MKKVIFFFALFCVSMLAGEAMAQDLTYQAKNPAFGGNYFNYSWMLSSAEAQNTIEDPEVEAASTPNQDPLANFQENLNRQILSQLSRQIVNSQFGTDGLEPGEYELGSYTINVSEGADGLQIEIYDTSTGGTTTVVVPNGF